MKINPFSNLIDVFLTRDDVHDVFGVIIYSDENPYVKKVLRDQDYWSALDHVSGPRWPVFSIRPAPGNYVRRLPNLGPGELGMMVDMVSEWNEPVENRDILELLNLDNTRTTPMLIVFCRGNNDEVLSMKHKLDEKNENRCYDSIRCAFKAVAQSIEQIRPEYIKNTNEVYNLIESGLKTEIFWSRVQKVAGWYKYIKALKP